VDGAQEIPPYFLSECPPLSSLGNIQISEIKRRRKKEGDKYVAPNTIITQIRGVSDGNANQYAYHIIKLKRKIHIILLRCFCSPLNRNHLPLIV